MTTSVTYYELNPGKPETKVTNVCFQPLATVKWNGREYVNSPLPTAVRYEAAIKGRLTNRMIEVYDSFLREHYDGGLWTLAFGVDPRRAIWTLKTKDLSRPQALAYLTAFRYVDEFPILIRQLLKLPKGPIEETFVRWQDIHVKATKTAGTKNLNLWGHGLLASAEKPVTISQFREKLKSPTLQSVQHCFVG